MLLSKLKPNLINVFIALVFDITYHGYNDKFMIFLLHHLISAPKYVEYKINYLIITSSSDEVFLFNVTRD